MKTPFLEYNFIKKTPTQVLSRKYFEIFNNIYFEEQVVANRCFYG